MHQILLVVAAVEVDPLIPQLYDLGDGDIAVVTSRVSSLEICVAISDATQPGVVVIPWGWWSQSTGGQVANSLTNDSLTDWGGGATFTDTRVSIRVAAPRLNS